MEEASSQGMSAASAASRRARWTLHLKTPVLCAKCMALEEGTDHTRGTSTTKAK